MLQFATAGLEIKKNISGGEITCIEDPVEESEESYYYAEEEEEEPARPNYIYESDEAEEPNYEGEYEEEY